MDKEISILLEEFGVAVKNEEEANKLMDILQNKLKFYKERNAQNEEWMSKLKIAPSDLNTESQKILGNLATIVETSHVESLDISDIGISLLDTMEKKIHSEEKINSLKGKQSDYLEEIHKYKDEIKKINEEIRLVKEQINKIDSVPDLEIISCQQLVNKYETIIKDMLGKNSWINNDEYNSLHIKEELKKLHKLRNEAEKLRKEVEKYEGLKPDLENARKQLADMKKEFEVLHSRYVKQIN